MLVAAPFAPLLSRYRGIFFAMLTLALSMVIYGLLMKLDALGGSDGFNVGRPTLLGQKLPDDRVGYMLYVADDRRRRRSPRWRCGSTSTARAAW